MNPIASIFIKLCIGAAIILSLMFFTVAGLAIAACVGVWYLIRRLRNNNTCNRNTYSNTSTYSGNTSYDRNTFGTEDEGDNWFHRITVQSDGKGGYVRTETSSRSSTMRNEGDVVDISPDEYREVETKREQKAIEPSVPSAQNDDKPIYC